MGDTPDRIEITIASAGEAGAGQDAMRLDKALASSVPRDYGLSRARLQQLIAQGMVMDAQGRVLTNPKKPILPGALLHLTLPKPDAVDITPQPIALDILYEDAALIVLNKPAGMVVHPAPGAPDGTLVNALLYHCGDDLSGIGGEKRPGIVHRIDKDTSGLLVVAKSDQAHQGLAAQFAAHSIHRRYCAICWGAPVMADPRIMGLAGVTAGRDGRLTINMPLGRHKSDRKKIAVRPDGRRAVTHVAIKAALAPPLYHIECALETGRTHQIRVHLAHIGTPLLGDPLYGRTRQPPADMEEAAKQAIRAFSRQALHAAELGFTHPISGEALHFTAPMPADMAHLLTFLTHQP